MYLFRPVREDDLNALETFAHLANVGFLNLPKSRVLMEREIHKSITSFQRLPSTSEKDFFLFALEDLKTQTVIGCSGIIAHTGIESPSFFYKIENILGEPYLVPVSYTKGPSEICAIFLLKDQRKKGVGKLLSLSRFLFIANCPENFEPVITAEMRGFIDTKVQSPFWNAIKPHFGGIEYAEIQQLIQENRSVIPKYMISHPFPISSLPEEAKEMIGKTHTNTVPALIMLEKEGFSYTGEVDLFDAGPRVASSTHLLKSVAHSVVATVQDIQHTHSMEEDVILSTVHLSFRATLGKIRTIDPTNVCLDAETAEILNVDVGEKIRYIKKHHEV